MKSYKQLIEYILDKGEPSEDRTGVGTLSVFGPAISINLAVGFPMLTVKKVFFGGVVDELLWFLSGSTNVNDLPERTQHWWRPWAADAGELGPIYGEQWRRQGYYDTTTGTYYVKDQLMDLIKGLKENPKGRRHAVNLWHGAAMDRTKLPCCHGSVIQFYVDMDRKLHCQTYQRSCDVFLGLPANLASYGLLTHMLAAQCEYEVGTLQWVGGDTHLYQNHIQQALLVLERDVRTPCSLVLDPAASILEYTQAHIHLIDYNPHPAIAAELAV